MEHLLNHVIQGDCLEVMQRIPDKSIDLILADLPYGTTQNRWDSVISLPALWAQYERIIKDNGAIVLTAQGIFTARLMLSNEKLFKYKLVWVKSKPTNFLNAKKQPLRKHEDICVFYKKQPPYHPQMSEGEPYDKGVRKDQLSGSYGDFKPRHVKSDGQRYPNDVLNLDLHPSYWDNFFARLYDGIPQDGLDALRRPDNPDTVVTQAGIDCQQEVIYYKTAELEGTVHHTTQKPVRLGQYLIRTYTDPGAVVLDNTCGSGSFLMAA